MWTCNLHGFNIHLGDVVFQALWTETSISIISTCKAQCKITVTRFQAHGKSLGFENHFSLLWFFYMFCMVSGLGYYIFCKCFIQKIVSGLIFVLCYAMRSKSVSENFFSVILYSMTYLPVKILVNYTTLNLSSLHNIL